MSLACVNGCTSRGIHYDDCPDPGTCKGCRIRPADLPHIVCFPDYTRTAQAITQAPDLVTHLLSQLEPGASSERGDEKSTKGDSAPAALNLNAATDADAIHTELAGWALVIMEEHPARLTGPDWQGSDIRPASKRRTEWGEAVYEDARVVGVRDAEATRRLCRWLGAHLDWALQQEWAGEMVTQVTRAINITKSRWPIEEPPKFLPARCPACGLRSLRRHAPTAPGEEAHITCSNRACTQIIDVSFYTQESA